MFKYKLKNLLENNYNIIAYKITHQLKYIPRIVISIFITF